MLTVPNIRVLLYYINEREAIRCNKNSGFSRPWTGDPILQRYKFTNVHRKHDWTTIQFKKLYDLHAKKAGPELTLLNCGINRYFGSAEFAQAVGWQREWNPGLLIEVAATRLLTGKRVFTGAYIIPNRGLALPKEQVVCQTLSLLNERSREIVEVMKLKSSWKAGYEVMQTLSGFGGTGFMAKEVLQDYLLTCWGNKLKDADTWTPVGPGARRGLNRLYERPLEYRQRDAAWEKEVQELRSTVAVQLPDLDLTAHDIQFCLCEVDKYLRVKNGEGRPRSTYTPRS